MIASSAAFTGANPCARQPGRARSMSATREAAVIRRFVEAFRPLNINAAIPSDVAGNIPQMLRADSESLDTRALTRALTRPPLWRRLGVTLWRFQHQEPSPFSLQETPGSSETPALIRRSGGYSSSP